MLQNSPFQRFFVFELRPHVWPQRRQRPRLVPRPASNLNSDGAAAVRVVSGSAARSLMEALALTSGPPAHRPGMAAAARWLRGAPRWLGGRIGRSMSSSGRSEMARGSLLSSWRQPRSHARAAGETQAAPDLVKRGDTKAAAALAVVTAATLPELEVLANSDDQRGADIARVLARLAEHRHSTRPAWSGRGSRRIRSWRMTDADDGASRGSPRSRSRRRVHHSLARLVEPRPRVPRRRRSTDPQRRVARGQQAPSISRCSLAHGSPAIARC